MSPRSSLRRIRRSLYIHRKAIILWTLGAILLLGGIFMVWVSTLKIPDLSSIENRKITQSLKIYDRTDTVLLYDLNQNVDRTIVPLSQMSPNVQEATIAIEDPTFYENPGVDWASIARAALADITHFGAVEGGSTLTQQVVKQTILTDEKTLGRKIEEIIIALKLTRVLSKDQILELYLNQAPYGGEIYGVEAASETFFGVHASQLTLPEAAYLAAMLPAPTYYSPYGSNKAELDTRKNLVLEKMYEHGYITSAQRDAAEAQTVTFLPEQPNGIQAPHFVFYVEQYLEQKYGTDALQEGGWSVITTLDADLQEHAQEIVQQGALVNQTKFNASNAGLIAIDPTNGQILAMVGSRNYFDTSIDGNFNVTLAPRQPGSAFKPFAYAEAFEKGYTPDTVLFDIPTQFSTTCAVDNLTNTNGCYSPVNYDNKFRGPMTMRDAIAQSINVPSVEVLYLAGISNTLSLAKSMGITTLGDPNQYGLTLVLGGGEVTLLQMTSAYGAFATDGIHYPTTAVLKILDGQGNVIEDDTQPVGTDVMPQNIAEEINDVLSDPVARAPLGENEYLYFPGYEVAAKTGTTNNYRDAWTIGYTPNLVVGIWAGNNDNTPMTHNVSGFIVGPMWNQFMQYALPTRSNQTFTRSDINTEGGLKPVLQGVWQGDELTDNGTGVICNVHNILYWLNKDDPNGPSPGPGSTDPQYPYWEAALQRWIAAGNGCTPGSTVPVTLAPASPSTLPGQATSTP
ncbi:MAG: PBP1A family penicillin-binding protein [Patescibacteria group bacterium]|nr:PBP1A family penicillin-binding protein [Patescibacteria group bacterium]